MASRSSSSHRDDNVRTESAAAARKRKRKPRPSTARGLRTSTGCLTCRRRRVKCDEGRPRCANCLKSDRDCEFPSANTHVTESADHPQKSHAVEAKPPAKSVPVPQALSDASLAIQTPSLVDGRDSVLNDAANIWPHFLPPLEPLQDIAVPQDSPATILSSLLDFDQTNLTANDLAPYGWYDLVAADALADLERHKHFDSELLNITETSLSRRRTPEPEPNDADQEGPTSRASNAVSPNIKASYAEPWNSPVRFTLDGDELAYFDYFINVVGPILDLFDPGDHFSVVVPHLALQNEGLLKSLLAVAARHLALRSEDAQPVSQTATRYYYETLRYLSQNLLYPSYTRSLELLATAICISTYEMFDAYTTANINSWQKHLQGAFFIQNV